MHHALVASLTLATITICTHIVCAPWEASLIIGVTIKCADAWSDLQLPSSVIRQTNGDEQHAQHGLSVSTDHAQKRPGALVMDGFLVLPSPARPEGEDAEFPLCLSLRECVHAKVHALLSRPGCRSSSLFAKGLRFKV